MRPHDGELIQQQSPLPSVSIRCHGQVPALVLFSSSGQLGIPLVQAISREDIPSLENANARDIFSGRPVGSKVAFTLTVRPQIQPVTFLNPESPTSGRGIASLRFTSHPSACGGVRYSTSRGERLCARQPKLSLLS